MNDFQWEVAIGLGIVLSGTLGCIVYILMLDYLESKNENNHN